MLTKRLKEGLTNEYLGIHFIFIRFIFSILKVLCSYPNNSHKLSDKNTNCETITGISKIFSRSRFCDNTFLTI